MTKLTNGIMQETKVTNQYWGMEKLSDIAEIRNGSTPSTNNPENWEGDIVWVTPNDLRDSGHYLEVSYRCVTEKGAQKISKEPIPANSLIMSSRAPVGYFSINKVPCYTNQGCKSFVFKDGFSVEFMYYELQHTLDQILRLSAGSTFTEVGKNKLTKLNVAFPKSYEQQQKIADILMSVDDEIEKTDRVIEKSEQLKRGILQTLFTRGIGHTEFQQAEIGQMPKEWSVVSFADTCHFRKEVYDPKKESEEMPYIGMEHIEQNTGVLLETSSSLATNSTKWRFHEGDILFNKLRPYLGKYWIADFKGVCSTEMFVLAPKQKVTREFLLYFISTPAFISYANQHSSGTRMPRANEQKLKELKLGLPEKSEQRQIVDALSTIDQKISTNKQLKDKLIQLKKGLMQDLLSE